MRPLAALTLAAACAALAAGGPLGPGLAMIAPALLVAVLIAAGWYGGSDRLERFIARAQRVVRRRRPTAGRPGRRLEPVRRTAGAALSLHLANRPPPAALLGGSLRPAA